MNDEMRRKIGADAQKVIDKDLPFEVDVVGGPMDYNVPGAAKLEVDTTGIDALIEKHVSKPLAETDWEVDGNGFEEYLELLKKNKDEKRMEEFFNWLVAQYGSALSQSKKEQAVIDRWYQRVREAEGALDALKNV